MLIENIDYYINEDGNFVFTETAHLKRGYCCKSRCLHCPWHYGRQSNKPEDEDKQPNSES